MGSATPADIHHSPSGDSANATPVYDGAVKDALTDLVPGAAAEKDETPALGRQAPRPGPLPHGAE